MSSLSKTCVLVCVVACMGLGAVAVLGNEGSETVRSMDANTDPVAVISPIPENISAGTQYMLLGNSSWDPGGYIVNHTWAITHSEETSYLYGAMVRYLFAEEGLYKIELTVTDAWNNTGVDFTAVISLQDADFDEMPDWWELGNFGSLEENATGDYDDDGYTNLQEYAGGLDPTIADPPPLAPGFLEENWEYVAVAIAASVGVALAMYPRIRRKRKELETKKIEIAIELEKSLDEE